MIRIKKVRSKMILILNNNIIKKIKIKRKTLLNLITIANFNNNISLCINKNIKIYYKNILIKEIIK